MSVVHGEIRHIVQLAVPVILAELGWMLMGVVDTIMVGPLGPTAIAAVSLGNAMFDVAGIFGIGLVLGLDTVISQAYGAGRQEECDRWLWQGLFLAAAATPPLILAIALSVPVMRAAGVQRGVLFEAEPYVRAMYWSLGPLLVYAVFRRYLQGIARVKAVMFALLTANLVNAAGNWLLIGRFGVAGVGWATFISRVYMAAVLGGYTFLREPAALRHLPAPRWTRIRELLRLGLPAAGQILIEVGVFATATVLAGKLATESLAAHHIVLTIAGTTFMVPLGISSAGAVAVGHALGRGDGAQAKRAGWIAIAMAAAFMAAMVLAMVAAPLVLLGTFTKNTDVLAIAVPLLSVAAVFQVFDGIQVTATGVLRGAGDTRTPMYANLVAHWVLGLPVGYFLCFSFGLGAVGIWMGLSAGLIVVGSLLLLVWWHARLSPVHNS
jgi:multidrug resistance protein, MATE family